MIALSWPLAALLALAAPARAAQCELTDNRCKAELYVKRAKEAQTAQKRALYFHAAHRSYIFLYDKTGDERDLCAARRMFDRSLAVKDQPPSQRASFESTRNDLESRERKSGAGCARAAQRPPAKDPPLIAVVSVPHAEAAPELADATPSPAAQNTPLVEQPATAAASDAPAAPTTRAATVSAIEPASRESDSGALLPVTRRPPARLAGPSPTSRPGRGLAIAGGVGLGLGLGLTGVAGYMGGRLSETVRNAQALSAMVDGHATDDQLAKDAALQNDYRRWGPPTLALALTGGTTLIVSAVLLGVGGHRMRKAASQTALVPVPGGLAIHARF